MPLNQDILRFWSHAAAHFGPASILNRVPKFIQEQPPANDTVRRCAFVGLNPSFDEGHEDYAWTPFWQNGANNYQQAEPLVNEMAQRHHNARHNDNNYWFLRLNRLAQEMRIERNDYLHLDMYLWLEADVNIVANLLMNPNLGALARRQECLFLELLDHLHPQDVLCLYPRVGNRIYQLCQRNLMGFWREGNWQLVPNTPLCQVTIYRLGNQQPITLFKPVGRPIPNGAWAMANQVFEDVRRFFHNRYAN